MTTIQMTQVRTWSKDGNARAGIGDVWIWRGQPYLCVEATRKAAHWVSRCPGCGAAVKVRTSRQPNASPTRRCGRCIAKRRAEPKPDKPREQVPVGDFRVVKGQKYTRLTEVSAEGWIRWETECAACGDPFRFSTRPHRVHGFVRRCKPCVARRRSERQAKIEEANALRSPATAPPRRKASRSWGVRDGDGRKGLWPYNRAPRVGDVGMHKRREVQCLAVPFGYPVEHAAYDATLLWGVACEGCGRVTEFRAACNDKDALPEPLCGRCGGVDVFG